MTDNPMDPQQGPDGSPGAVPPQQPPQGQPQQPPQPPQQGQQPVAPPPGGYAQPPQGGYQQPPQGYQQPGYGAGADVSTLQLNLWLSAFFFWVPALIFFLVEKDKVDPVMRKALADNLNFQLIRSIAQLAAMILILIPFLGALLYFAVAVAGLVIGIMHAVKVPPQVQAGQYANYMVTPSWVK